MSRLEVTAVEALKLLGTDTSGLTDPKMYITIGDTTHKTKVILQTKNPKWNESFVFEVEDPLNTDIKAELYDSDTALMDDYLGRVEFNTSRLTFENNAAESWFNLTYISTGRIHLSFKILE